MEGSDIGIGFSLCDDIAEPILDDAVVLDEKYYHSIKEVKKGTGPNRVRARRLVPRRCGDPLPARGFVILREGT